MNDYLNVGIVGCGLIGKKRAAVIQKDEFSRLCCATDLDIQRPSALLKEYGNGLGGNAYQDWQKMLDQEELNVLIVATPNKFLKDIVMAALSKKIHVLSEKPLGRNHIESFSMVKNAENNSVILKTGFNHRYHPAIWKAHELIESGTIGTASYIRCIYGHGGRPGYEKEWRANRDVCGGGEMLDQGVHIVDLFRWFMGDFEETFAYTTTSYWNMEVEDNAFVMFKTATGQVAQMHTSWTQWKNRFTFEIFGKAGYLIINGLGGSYGPETLIIGKRPVNSANSAFIGGAPHEEVFVFDEPDQSWDFEWKDFIKAIKNSQLPLGNGHDGLEANRMIAAVYKSAIENKPVRISDIITEG